MTPNIEQACTALTTVVKQCSLAALENAEQFPKAFAMARGIAQLRELITPELMKEIMPLMNTALGFQTDKNPSQIDYKTGKPHIPYTESVVKECFIESVLRGYSPVGNEWNILAGRCYVTKGGLGRKLKELDGLTDFKPFFGVPRMAGDKSAVVAASATWRMQGVPDKIEREFSIKVNAGMGSDAIVGKAERKLRAAAYEQITGSRLTDGDADDEADAIPTTAAKSADVPLAEKLKQAQQPASAREDRTKILVEINDICKVKFQAKILGDVLHLASEALNKKIERQADILDSDLDGLLETLRQAPAPTAEESGNAAA